MTEFFLRKYKTSETPPEVLEAIFVQRHELANSLVQRVRESALTGNKHFVLLVGPRGIGKTHLVSLVVHRVVALPEVADRLRVAWLDENQTSTSLATLLNRAVNSLAKRYPTEFSVAATEAAHGKPPKQAAEVLAHQLLEQLGDRTCLVVVENFDEIMEHMGLRGQQELRAFLQQHPRFAVLASSQQLFDGVSLRTSPFYGMFQVEHLQTLSLEASIELFQRFARENQDTELLEFLGTKTGQDRVKALHFLSGGMPRLHVMLAEFVTKQTLDELVSLFEKLRDELTNYYLERMRWLSPQQREIVQWLCQREAATPVKELATALFMQPKDVSTQLMRLRDLGYVVSTPSGKESLYDLTEPLMRLSLNEDQRHTPDAPIPLIVEFLRVWFSREEMESMRGRTTLPKALATLNAAMQRASAEPMSSSHATSIRTDSDTRPELKTNEHIICGLDLYFAARFSEALSEFNEHLADYPDDPLGLVNRGVVYGELGEIQKAIADYTRVIDEFTDAPVEPKATALINRGFEYQQLGENQKAILDYKRVIYELTDAPFEQKARALNRRACAYRELGEFSNALADIEQLLWFAPDERFLYFSRVEVLLVSGDWQSVWIALEAALVKFRAGAEDSREIEAIIQSILQSGLDAQVWQARVRKLVELYAATKHLANLGDGLVQSLKLVPTDRLSESAMDEWRRVWLEVVREVEEQSGCRLVELQIPLRLFDVGMRFLATGNHRVLFDLPLEQRQLLKEHLNIPDEPPAKSKPPRKSARRR